MVNDINTLNGALSELGETLAANITTKGVTASASDGLTTLAGKVLQITGGGGATNIAQGTFTTSSTGGSTGTVNLSYNGNGYPIMALVYVDGGISKTGTDWYTTVARYDVGLVIMVKGDTTVSPTYSTSGSQNYGVTTYVAKGSSSNATTYTRGGSQDNNTYTNSSTNASAIGTMIRFKGNGKTLSYYVGNRTSTTYGLARNTKFAYIVIYSE